MPVCGKAPAWVRMGGVARPQLSDGSADAGRGARPIIGATRAGLMGGRHE